MIGVLFIGFIVLSGFLYDYTMRLIYAFIHGKEKKMEARLDFETLRGALLVALAAWLLLSLI